ncbi:SRPBCC family protein [Aquipuribacter hungaricus]|uniref:SRPBCC family protein n=1 Tax=Aquipuribacter hungaricus TaxID=545624 RepID=A0ABV7WEW4_9MICO
MSITSARTVAAPASRVHDLLVDVDAWQLWSPHVVSVDPPGGQVVDGWTGRVRPFFGPATTMRVTRVRPDAGYAWSTRALGHRLDYDWTVRPTGEQRCVVSVTADVHGPAGTVVEGVVGWLSAFGQRRRLERLAVLAEGWQRA